MPIVICMIYNHFPCFNPLNPLSILLATNFSRLNIFVSLIMQENYDIMKNNIREIVNSLVSPIGELIPTKAP